MFITGKKSTNIPLSFTASFIELNKEHEKLLQISRFASSLESTCNKFWHFIKQFFQVFFPLGRIEKTIDRLLQHTRQKSTKETFNPNEYFHVY
jgi:hypothetical protein